MDGVNVIEVWEEGHRDWRIVECEYRERTFFALEIGCNTADDGKPLWLAATHTGSPTWNREDGIYVTADLDILRNVAKRYAAMRGAVA